MIYLLIGTQSIRDNPGFFGWIVDGYVASRNRIEEVIGHGNFKWLLFALIVLLLLWFARRRR